ncbi:aspartyl/asparaginyl beta-hydroxylase domain-containing protein [Shewanella sp. A14]
MHICSFALLAKINNIEQLRQEVDTLPENAWLPHVNKLDYQGHWDVMPLRCAVAHQTAHPILQAFAIQMDTQWRDLPILDTCPGIVNLLDSLACTVKSVRLMRLQPHSKIKPHRDIGLSIEQDEARLHLSLQTNDKLHFMVNDQLVPMVAGELWYMNADQIHSVENHGTEARINLVIDCAANTWLKELINAAKITP